MKRLLCVMIAALLTLLAGCGSAGAPTGAPEKQPSINPADDGPTQLPAQTLPMPQVHYIRTDGYREAEPYPKVWLIESETDLNSYRQTWQEVYDLGPGEKISSGIGPGFADVCQGYDAEFFREHSLLLILLEEGSGSVRHEVTEVKGRTQGDLKIWIQRHSPEVGTCDMAQWHLLLELPRAHWQGRQEDVQVYVNDLLSWSGGQQVIYTQPALYPLPPDLTVYTPLESAVISAAVCSWNYVNVNGPLSGLEADQAGRPLPAALTESLYIPAKYLETVYLPIPGTQQYAPTQANGCMIKLSWDTQPDHVRCVCWPDSLWAGVEQTPQPHSAQPDGPVYALEGGWIYEFTAVWEDRDRGFWGTANYYLHIQLGDEGSPS